MKKEPRPPDMRARLFAAKSTSCTNSAPRKCKAAGACCGHMKFCARAAAGPRAFLFLLCCLQSKIAAQKDARSIHRKPCAALCPVFRLRMQTASNTVAGPRGSFTRFPGGRRRPIGAPAMHKTVSVFDSTKYFAAAQEFFKKNELVFPKIDRMGKDFPQKRIFQKSIAWIDHMRSFSKEDSFSPQGISCDKKADAPV